jgi:hypothetical protein
METIRAHAHELLAKRLAPAERTRTASRRPIEAGEHNYAVEVICRWIETESGGSGVIENAPHGAP